jgi:hypothetical protein
MRKQASRERNVRADTDTTAKLIKGRTEDEPNGESNTAKAFTRQRDLRRLEAKEERAFFRWQQVAYELECAWFERERGR